MSATCCHEGSVDARSYLFVPGDRPDRFEKAWASGADAVILDLEDSVLPEAKGRARDAVAQWLSVERPVYVRVNGMEAGGFQEDINAVAKPGLIGIVLPKAEDPQQIDEIVRRIPTDARVLPILETAMGVWNALEVAAAPGVERLAFGSIDLQLDTGISGDGEELLYARSRMVLASRVARILPPLDGVTTALDDADRLTAEVDRARRLGFGGKLCIHPRQVDPVNQGFSPTPADIDWARHVLEAVESLESGVSQLEGVMVDRPVIERARRIVARATA